MGHAVVFLGRRSRRSIQKRNHDSYAMAEFRVERHKKRDHPQLLEYNEHRVGLRL